MKVTPGAESSLHMGWRPGGEIDDAEPGMGKTSAVLRVKSGIVRPAVRKHADHPLEGFRSDGHSIEIAHACNTA